MSKLWLMLVVLNVGFIWSNALQDGETSSAASGFVVDITEEVLDTVNIEVSEDELTQVVRSLAHVTQYLTFGIFFTLFLISINKSFAYLYISGLVMLIDEWFQTLVPGRAFELSDLGLDTLGFTLGVSLILTLVLGRKLVCVES
jgi:VanZ family protein